MGLSVGLGLRYRLLWFGSSGGLGGGGGCMVRKWKWSLQTILAFVLRLWLGPGYELPIALSKLRGICVAWV